MIVTSRKWLKVWFSCLLAAAVVLALAGCGGDDEDEPADTATETRTEETAPAPTASEPEDETEPEEPQTETEPEPTEREERPPETSPEDAPGGAGDEVPARSLALFTGEGGRITPRVVRVPSFISVRVELRSADGRPYGLRFGSETIRVTGALASVSTTFQGLRPGAALTGRPIGVGTRVRIEATAEPGP